MLKWLLITIGILAIAIGGFVGWSVWATYHGERQAYLRLAALIRPVEDRLVAGQEPDPADVERFAKARETRLVLYDALKDHGRADLFPRQYATAEAFAEADLVLWLYHPNELDALPDDLELMARVSAPGDPHSQYFVFRFRTSPPHWAASKGWLAGVAGPYPVSGPISPRGSDTFSRFEAYSSRRPEDHVRAVLGK